MSEVVGEGVIRLTTDTSGVDVAGAGSQAGQGYSKGFLGSIKGLVVGIGAVLAARKVVDFVKDSVAEAREAQKVAATSEQIIKQTGGTANVTADYVGKLATAIGSKNAMDDELIQKGANLLLTFKNVRNEAGKGSAIFDRATAASADLAAAGFGSVESGAKGLGKALNDPVKGITALSRAGVTFTEGQKKQIESMVEAGDILGAQKIILGEVESQVGGVAAAQATAGEKAAFAWGQVKEAVGTALLPVLDTLANFFVDTIVPAIYDLMDAARGLGPIFSTIKAAIMGAFTGGGSEALTGFMDVVREAVTTILPVMQDTFVNKLLPALQSFGEYLIANVLPILRDLGAVVINDIIPVVVELATWIYGTLYPAFIDIVTAVATRLKPVFDTFVQVLRDDVVPVIQDLVKTFRDDMLPVLQPIIERMVKTIGVFLKIAAVIISVVLPPVLKFAGFLIRTLVPAVAKVIVFVLRFVNFLGSLSESIVKGIGKVLGFGLALQRLVSEGLDKVVSAVASLPGRVLALGGKLLNAGKGIMGKFLDGLKNAGGFVSGIAEAVWGAVKGVINGAIDKLNSLLEFTIDVGPKSFTVNPPNIGHLARGTDSWRGGLAVVGERGPELLNLPRGSQVIPNDRLAAAGARADIHVMLPTGDPEAAAMAMMNRLVAVGFVSG